MEGLSVIGRDSIMSSLWLENTLWNVLLVIIWTSITCNMKILPMSCFSWPLLRNRVDGTSALRTHGNLIQRLMLLFESLSFLPNITLKAQNFLTAFHTFHFP